MAKTDPNRAKPQTLAPLPHRPKDRRLSELPRCRKSSTASPEPRRAKARRASEEPTCTKSKTARLEPKRATPWREMLLPHRAKALCSAQTLKFGSVIF